MTRLKIAYAGCAGVMLTVAAIRLLGGQAPLDFAALRAGDPLEQAILIHFRGPRLTLALITGAALGMAGTASQVMLRNPLASPDIIGLGAGASAGAAAAILIFGDLTSVPLGALAGAAGAAALVMALAWRDGISPLSLVLIGVSLNLMLMTGTDILLSLSPDVLAGEAVRLLTGSFASADWRMVGIMGGAAVICGGGLAVLAFSIDRLELGDDLAVTLGIKPNHVRFYTIACAAMIIAAAVTVAGPVPFVAFLAGPIARMLAGRPGSLLGLSALIGAVLAGTADALSAIPVSGTRLPAGVYTALIGAPAMLILLLRLEGDRK